MHELFGIDMNCFVIHCNSSNVDIIMATSGSFKDPNTKLLRINDILTSNLNLTLLGITMEDNEINIKNFIKNIIANSRR